MKYISTKLCTAALIACTLCTSSVPVLAYSETEPVEEIVPRNIETWSGSASWVDGDRSEVVVVGVMTYANGNWGARGEIHKATGSWEGARITQALCSPSKKTVTLTIKGPRTINIIVEVH